MLATIIQSVPAYDALWWLAALWFFRSLCLWSFFWANCPCCPAGCTHCSGSTPGSYQIEASGFTNNGCLNCNSYNSTFVVPQSGGSTSCFFTLLNLGFCGTPEDWDLTITATAITVFIDVDFVSDTDLPTFAKTGLTAPFDCSASAEAFPVTFAGDQTLCFHDGSDLIVTSL